MVYTLTVPELVHGRVALDELVHIDVVSRCAEHHGHASLGHAALRKNRTSSRAVLHEHVHALGRGVHVELHGSVHTHVLAHHRHGQPGGGPVGQLGARMEAVE